MTSTDLRNPLRRSLRGVRHVALLEPNSVTDARARVAQQPFIAPRPVRLRRSLVRPQLALFVGDALALIAVSLLFGATWVRAVPFFGLVLVSRATMRQYRPRLSSTVLDDLPRSIGSTLAAVGLTLVFETSVLDSPPSGAQLIRAAGAFLALSIVLQAIVSAVALEVRRRRHTGRRTLLVGTNRVGATLGEALAQHPELGLVPVGFADPGSPADVSQRLVAPVLATDMTQLTRTIVDHRIDTAVLALSDGDAHVDTVITVHQTGCEILLVPPMFEMHHDGPDVERVRGVPLIRLRPDPTLRLSWWIKRAGDVVAGVLGLIMLAVPLALIAVAILMESGRPVLFWQERVGLDGRVFRLCKFRSMRSRPEQESQAQWTIAGDPGVTRVGKLLRRSSADEIPQLWNIVRGQMSLVGPRPERPGFVAKFSAEHERYWARHRVPVGLTGLAQVNGLRGDTSIRERARYDNYYIANWSLWLDLKILMLTVREVLGGRGR